MDLLRISQKELTNIENMLRNLQKNVRQAPPRIFQEMKHPYPMSDSGGLPTPLTGIETPRVDVEERGAQRHKPVYGMGLPFSNLLKMPSSPPKKSSEPQPSNSPLDPVSVPPSIPKESSSSEHSSSDSSAEESDDENVNLVAFIDYTRLKISNLERDAMHSLIMIIFDAIQIFGIL